jgi:hypothetical protein
MPIPQLELGTWLRPFEIGDTYDAGLRALGDLSFAGEWAITPFGGNIKDGAVVLGENPDMWFEVVPGTVLRASISGFAIVSKNPDAITPEGNVIESQDWEIHIEFGGGNYWLEYDHVVDVLIENGTQVVAGQPLAKGAPASIRHGGPGGDNPVEEFEWGIRHANFPGTCPFIYLTAEGQADVLRGLDQIKAVGLPSGDGPCLQELVGEYYTG